MTKKKKWGDNLSINDIEERIWSIERKYPKGQHIDLDKDFFHPYDRNNLIKYYNLLYKRKENENESHN